MIRFNCPTAIKMKACVIFTLVSVILGAGAIPMHEITEETVEPLPRTTGAPRHTKFVPGTQPPPTSTRRPVEPTPPRCRHYSSSIFFWCFKEPVSLDNGVITCGEGRKVKYILYMTHEEYFSCYRNASAETVVNTSTNPSKAWVMSMRRAKITAWSWSKRRVEDTKEDHVSNNANITIMPLIIAKQKISLELE